MSDVGSHAGAPAERAPLPARRGGFADNVYQPQVTLGPEAMVRGFIAVQSTPRPRALPAPPPKQQPEAFIRWGQQSSFAGQGFREEAKQVERSASYDPDGDDSEPLKRRRETYAEEGRNWTDVRVVNSQGNVDQYLIVREGHEIALGGWFGDCRQPDKLLVDRYGDPLPNEAQFILLIGVDTVGEDLETGQDPEYPPAIDELNENQAWVDWQDRN